MTTRNVSLTSALDQFVEDQVQSGTFQNASEVVRAGLRLLKRDAEEHERKLARLKAAVQEGIDEIERGEGIEVGWDELDGWLDGLGRETTSR
jgi:antitoxin ParD1/3/4